MFPLLQQSGVANRWQRSDFTVTRRRRPRPFTPSLLSALRSNRPTELDTALANPGFSKHHTQAYPRTKSGTDAFTFWRRFGFRIESSRGRGPGENSRLLQETLVTMGKPRRPRRPARCPANKRRALHLVLYASLSKGGEILAHWLPAILRICQAIRAPLDEPQQWIRGARAILR